MMYTLLMNILAKLAKERLQYLKYFNKLENIPDEIVINKESFEKEAIEIGLSHLDDFYNSMEFKNKNKLEKLKGKIENENRIPIKIGEFLCKRFNDFIPLEMDEKYNTVSLPDSTFILVIEKDQ